MRSIFPPARVIQVMNPEPAIAVPSSAAASSRRELARQLPKVWRVLWLLIVFAPLIVRAQYATQTEFELGYGISGGTTAQTQLRSTPGSMPVTVIVLNNSGSSKTIRVRAGFPTYNSTALSNAPFNLVSTTILPTGGSTTVQTDFLIGNLSVSSAITHPTFYPIGSAGSGANSVVGNPPAYFSSTRDIILETSDGSQIFDTVSLSISASVKVINTASGFTSASLSYSNAKSFNGITLYLAIDPSTYNANNPRPGTGPPVITKQPLSDSRPPNTPHTFTLEATGSNLSYQWYRVEINGDLTNEYLLSGATGTSLNVQSPDGVVNTESHYYCKVSNLSGTVNSQIATLYVNQPMVNYTYRVRGFNATGFASKVYFLCGATAYEVDVPAFGQIDSQIQTRQAPEETGIGIDLNGAILGPNSQMPVGNIVFAGANFEYFLDIKSWDPQVFIDGNPPPTPQGSVSQSSMSQWDNQGNEQQTQIYEYTPYNGTNPDNTPATVVESPNGQYQQIGDQPLTFNIPLGDQTQPYNGPTADEIGEAVNAHDAYKGPTAEEIAEAIHQKTMEEDQALKDQINSLQDNQQAGNQAQNAQNDWLNLTPSVGAYNFGAYTADPNFWIITFNNPKGPGSAPWFVDLYPYSKPWIMGVMNFIKAGLAWIATIYFIHQTWGLFREAFIYSTQSPQTQGVDGGALGGTISLPSGYVYAGIVTVALAAFIPLVSTVLLTFPTSNGGYGFLGLEGLLTSAVLNFTTLPAFREAWIFINVCIPIAHFLTLWAIWWINSFAATAYAMAFNVLVRWLVK